MESSMNPYRPCGEFLVSLTPYICKTGWHDILFHVGELNTNFAGTILGWMSIRRALQVILIIICYLTPISATGYDKTFPDGNEMDAGKVIEELNDLRIPLSKTDFVAMKSGSGTWTWARVEYSRKKINDEQFKSIRIVWLDKSGKETGATIFTSPESGIFVMGKFKVHESVQSSIFFNPVDSRSIGVIIRKHYSDAGGEGVEEDPGYSNHYLTVFGPNGVVNTFKEFREKRRSDQGWPVEFYTFDGKEGFLVLWSDSYSQEGRPTPSGRLDYFTKNGKRTGSVTVNKLPFGTRLIRVGPARISIGEKGPEYGAQEPPATSRRKKPNADK
jgi:hypothetical protein